MIFTRRFCISVFCAALLLSPAASHAEEVVLKADVEPRPGAQDVLGFRPGMPQAEARALLAKEVAGVEAKETTSSLTMNYRGVRVQSASYLDRLEASGGGQRLTLFFATPADGGALVGVDRAVIYPDVLAAPQVADVLRSLEEKYGPPSFRFPDNSRLIWAFGPRGMQPCKSLDPGCANISADFQPGRMKVYGRAVEMGQALVIAANVTPHKADRSKLHALSVVLSDNGAKLANGTSALKQMEAAAQQTHQSSSRPQSAPRL
ncbi:hypothetical protein GCM10007301_06180 [Azorhizobium oxalatiphilum]|uniref:Uncharacterized protein n=1 Tax=Azorhizobium oxalatiphilum TaxID=980631 RepID=A0A917BLZ8_9HYPH|nr:hypothetical protein [Azorhizobium oxalatiphilum]GGF49698.1 hypothetical protein GCM10007301_06180 [Azorhizobium oxalatiphilum]